MGYDMLCMVCRFVWFVRGWFIREAERYKFPECKDNIPRCPKCGSEDTLIEREEGA